MNTNDKQPLTNGHGVGGQSWPDELKEIVNAVIDLAVRSFAARGSNLVLNEVLNADELSTRLKVPVSTIEELARKGKLPGAFRVGKHWRFDLDRLRMTLPDTGNERLENESVLQVARRISRLPVIGRT
jgi:excisionase family DNA binding protein